MSNSQRLRPASGRRDLSYPLALIGFIAFGLRGAILGVAWPSIRTVFDLQQSSLGIILLASGIGYLGSGLVLGRVIGRIGVGRLLVISTAILTVTTIGLAVAPSYALFLFFSMLAGIGTGALDAGVNFFATRHFTETGMNRLHGCYGIGALAGPVLMGVLLGAGLSWRIGYLVAAVVLAGLTVMFVMTRQLWETPAPSDSVVQTIKAMNPKQVLAMPVLWVCLLLFFLNSGIEQTSGQWAFSVVRDGMGKSDQVSSLWAGLFWGGMAFGRLTLGGAAARVGILRWIQGGVLSAVFGALVYALAPYPIAPFGLLIIGLSMSTVFPLMMMLTPARVGQSALAHAIGFQMGAATIGSSAIPWVAGYLFARTSYHAVAWVIAVGAMAFFVVHGVLIRWQMKNTPAVPSTPV